jgi:hypothetical protein
LDEWRSPAWTWRRHWISRQSTKQGLHPVRSSMWSLEQRTQWVIETKGIHWANFPDKIDLQRM